jgi:hypothetical protein
MIDTSQYADALKLRLPYKNNNTVANKKTIEALEVVNQEVFLTITNHDISENENYWSVYGIKYKYPITKIQKQPNIRYEGVDYKYFIIDVDPNNPVIYSDTQLTISGVTIDAAYNGVFTILKPSDLGTEKGGLFNQFSLITQANITTQEILNQGFLLYEITDSDITKNALNGRKQITIVDENTIKYSINLPDNKYQWAINDFDITNAKIGQVQAFFVQSEDSIDGYVATLLSQDAYSIFITTPTVSGSTGGVINSSATIQNSSQRMTRIDRDVFFRIIVMSPKAEVINDINTKYTELYRQATEIFCGIEHITTTTLIELPEYLRLVYNITVKAMFLGFQQYKVYQNNARASWVMDFKVTVMIDPRSFPDYTMSVPLRMITMTEGSKQLVANYDL